MNKRLYCIYCHTNKINNKKYIGLTCQTPKDRWDSGHGYKSNRYFWSAIKKYGWHNFSHEILFDGLSQEEAKLKEIELISNYSTHDRLLGYNITLGGESGNGIILSKESRMKISKANKGRVVSEETRAKISKSNLGKICKRGIDSLNYGRKASDEARLNMSKAQSGVKHRLYGKHQSQETRNKIGKAKSIPIIQLDANGKFIKRWNNLTSATNYGFLDSKISSCCKGKRITHGGYIWLYEKDYNNLSQDDILYMCKKSKEKLDKYSPIKIVQLATDNEFIREWNSISETVKYGFNKGCISNCCLGRTKTHKGYRWMYLKDYKINRD